MELRRSRRDVDRSRERSFGGGDERWGVRELWAVVGKGRPNDTCRGVKKSIVSKTYRAHH